MDLLHTQCALRYVYNSPFKTLQKYFSRAKIEILLWQVIVQTLSGQGVRTILYNKLLLIS